MGVLRYLNAVVDEKDFHFISKDRFKYWGVMEEVEVGCFPMEGTALLAKWLLSAVTQSADNERLFLSMVPSRPRRGIGCTMKRCSSWHK